MLHFFSQIFSDFFSRCLIIGLSYETYYYIRYIVDISLQLPKNAQNLDDFAQHNINNYFFHPILQLNLIGRLQLSTERSQQEDNQSIVQLRILRTQEAIIKIMKMRKKMNNAALQVSSTAPNIRLIEFPNLKKSGISLQLFLFQISSFH